MKNKKCKYIFVTGGVLSGVGKGITAASIGAILKAKGYKVTMQKCDPYLNVDAGLLNPVEHGECFVTHDGVETDLDLGHYERFLDFETNKYSITLSGSIYKELIERERSGGFHGRTVQLVPHFTGLVCEKIEKASAESDIHIVEIGGTIGDYEGLPFVEAIRLFANKVGRRNCLYVSAERAKRYHGPLETDYYGRTVPKSAHGSQNMGGFTSSTEEVVNAILSIYDRTVNPDLFVRRMYVVANHVKEAAPEASAEKEVRYEQLSLFDDHEEEEQEKARREEQRAKERRIQEAMLEIRERYGGNAILKGTDLQEGATARERNQQIGGHRA